MGWKIRHPHSKGENHFMIFIETELSGAHIIEPENLEDERGFFARVFDKKEFEDRGLNTEYVQTSISFNKQKGTFRGMHYQIEPFEEEKLVRCTKGKIFDVILDLRPQSKTFKKWTSVELSEDNHKIIYIPKGFAHGFQTLENNSEIFYEISQYYNSDYSKGIKWDDPSFDIKIPLDISIISKKDLAYPKFK